MTSYRAPHPETGTNLRNRLRAILFVLLFLAAQVPIAKASNSQHATSTTQLAPRSAQLPVRWGFYITYNPNSWVSLQANAQYLNYVSPWFFNLNADAQITGRDRPEVTALLKQVGAKSLPMLKNTPTYNDFTAILTDTNKQTSIINQADALIAANGYDGLTLDFEGVNAADKAALTAFVGRLYDRLHSKGKLLAMAVPVKTREITTGWAAAYDYPALANVLDYMLVMAYDYHWVNSGPGPIAPMPKLRDSANYTVANVSPDKVIWGVGVYGYDWGVGGGKPAEYRNFNEATAMAQVPGAQSGYDEDSQSPWVRYTRDGQPRELWYENRRSFDAKVSLITDYNLAGFGIWRVGQEDPDVWQSIARLRNPTACQPTNPPPQSPDKVYFPETGHSLGGGFLKYWRSHGGLPIYGYPLTEEFAETSPTDGKSYTVQYFERNRFEYHPENRPPNDVLLGLLGVQVTQSRSFPPADDPVTGPDVLFFPQVQHTLGGPFLRYWQKFGGLAQFGYPISEPVVEQSQTNGKTYTVQYFERARFEFHPEYQGTDAEVLLGLLGLDVVPCE